MRHAQEKLPIHGDGFTKNVIELFLQDLARFPMPVTRQTSQPLRDFLKKIQDRASGSVLSEDEAKELVKIACDITPTFEAESRNIMTVVLLDKRFDMGKLISAVPTLLSKGVFDAFQKWPRQT